MIDAELIRDFGKIAGIGGLALAVFLLIARNLIRKAVFPSLTKQQSSRIILTFGIMAWTVALAGIASWTYTSVQQSGVPVSNGSGSPEFPSSDSDKKTVAEMLAYLELKLSLLNQIYGSFSKTWNAAQEYINDAEPSRYNAFVSYVKSRQREIQEVKNHNHPLSQSLREKIFDTPISAENLAVLYDLVNLQADELSERLAFLLVLFDPDLPFDRQTREKWLTVVREQNRQMVLQETYAVCELLWPVDPAALREFRIDVLPKLTEFESDAFNFNADETQLKQLQNAADRKRAALGDELLMVVGGLNVEAQVLKDRLREIRMQLEKNE